MSAYVAETRHDTSVTNRSLEKSNENFANIHRLMSQLDRN